MENAFPSLNETVLARWLPRTRLADLVEVADLVAAVAMA
jgi:hypothetical protein